MESDGTTQCQDGLDNDSDGLVDLADPGCSNSQDNTEDTATSQCQDGIDNDGDGFTDYPADFSCSTRTDNDETNPKSQCQDGVDNDTDSLIDSNDPGCTNNQDNTENTATSQCQDGIDNDADGATDHPADFSCAAKTDNDETNPKAQCQDGIDNDSDGYTDQADSGCSTKQDNNESDGTPQCQDRIDNDSDSAIDFPSDFGCSSATDNDEGDRRSSCQDGIDNDGDGLIDSNDPGCSSNQDNDESDETKSIIPFTECVTENGDGTFTAYFGYENPNAAQVVIPVASASAAGANYFTTGAPDRGQTQAFKPGRNQGSFRVSFNGDPITWAVQPRSSLLLTTTASRNSTRCVALVPRAECIEFASGGQLQATFGYTNNNPFPIALPIGAVNKFSPGASDRGQPTNFTQGQVNSVFKVPFAEADTIEWLLNGRSASASSSIPFCSGSEGCTSTPIVDTKTSLDSLALQLTSVTKQMANELLKLSSLQPAVIRDANRAKKKADAFLVEAQALVFKVPDVIRSCPNAPEFCAQVDNKATIDGLGSLYVRQWSQIKRTVARIQFRKSSATRNRNKLFIKTRTAYKAGLESLKSIPRYATECE